MSAALTIAALLLAIALIIYWINTGDFPDVMEDQTGILVEPFELSKIIINRVIEHDNNTDLM